MQQLIFLANCNNGLLRLVRGGGLFTYYQENKSSKIMESFAKMTPPVAQVETTFSSL